MSFQTISVVSVAIVVAVVLTAIQAETTMQQDASSVGRNTEQEESKRNQRNQRLISHIDILLSPLSQFSTSDRLIRTKRNKVTSSEIISATAPTTSFQRTNVSSEFIASSSKVLPMEDRVHKADLKVEPTEVKVVYVPLFKGSQGHVEGSGLIQKKQINNKTTGLFTADYGSWAKHVTQPNNFRTVKQHADTIPIIIIREQPESPVMQQQSNNNNNRLAVPSAGRPIGGLQLARKFTSEYLPKRQPPSNVYNHQFGSSQPHNQPHHLSDFSPSFTRDDEKHSSFAHLHTKQPPESGIIREGNEEHLPAFNHHSPFFGQGAYQPTVKISSSTYSKHSVQSGNDVLSNPHDRLSETPSANGASGEPIAEVGSLHNHLIPVIIIQKNTAAVIRSLPDSSQQQMLYNNQQQEQPSRRPPASTTGWNSEVSSKNTAWKEPMDTHKNIKPSGWVPEVKQQQQQRSNTRLHEGDNYNEGHQSGAFPVNVDKIHKQWNSIESLRSNQQRQRNSSQQRPHSIEALQKSNNWQFVDHQQGWISDGEKYLHEGNRRRQAHIGNSAIEAYNRDPETITHNQPPQGKFQDSKQETGRPSSSVETTQTTLKKHWKNPNGHYNDGVGKIRDDQVDSWTNTPFSSLPHHRPSKNPQSDHRYGPEDWLIESNGKPSSIRHHPPRSLLPQKEQSSDEDLQPYISVHRSYPSRSSHISHGMNPREQQNLSHFQHTPSSSLDLQPPLGYPRGKVPYQRQSQLNGKLIRRDPIQKLPSPPETSGTSFNSNFHSDNSFRPSSRNFYGIHFSPSWTMNGNVNPLNLTDHSQYRDAPRYEEPPQSTSGWSIKYPSDVIDRTWPSTSSKSTENGAVSQIDRTGSEADWRPSCAGCRQSPLDRHNVRPPKPIEARGPSPHERSSAIQQPQHEAPSYRLNHQISEGQRGNAVVQSRLEPHPWNFESGEKRVQPPQHEYPRTDNNPPITSDHSIKNNYQKVTPWRQHERQPQWTTGGAIEDKYRTNGDTAANAVKHHHSSAPAELRAAPQLTKHNATTLLLDKVKSRKKDTH